MIEKLTWQMAGGLELPISIKGFLNQVESYGFFKAISDIGVMKMKQEEIENIEVLTYSCRTASAHNIIAFIVKIGDKYSVAILDDMTINKVSPNYDSDLETNKPYVRFLEQLENRKYDKMAQAKESALKQMNAILQRRKIEEQDKSNKYNPYELMLLKRMGKQINIKKGYDFTIIEMDENTLHIVATGDSITPTTFAEFKTSQFNPIGNHYSYNSDFYYEGDIDYLHMIRDYFKIISNYGKGDIEQTFVKQYYWWIKDDIDFRDFNGDYTVLNSYLRYILKCFEENSKKDEDIEKSDLYGIPEYVSTILKERNKIRKVQLNNKVPLSNELLPITYFKDHYRLKGNQNNPSNFYLMKGKFALVSFWVNYKRNSYEITEVKIMNYIKPDTNKYLYEEVANKIRDYKNNVRISRNSLLSFIKDLSFNLNQYRNQKIDSTKTMLVYSRHTPYYWYDAYPNQAFNLYGTQKEKTIETQTETDLIIKVIDRDLELQVHWDLESCLWEFNIEDDEELEFDENDPHLVRSQSYYDFDPFSEN